MTAYQTCPCCPRVEKPDRWDATSDAGGFEGSDGGIQMQGSCRAILGFGEFNCPAIRMHLRPGAGILLAEAHPGVDARRKLSQMLKEPLSNHLFAIGRIPHD